MKLATQNEHTGLQVAEFNDEPNWLKISQLHGDLRWLAGKLHENIDRYKSALNELDGAGTDISFGKERIAALREEIARLEAGE